MTGDAFTNPTSKNGSKRAGRECGVEDGFNVVLVRCLLLRGDCGVAAFRPFVPDDGPVVAGPGSDTLCDDTPNGIHGQKLSHTGYRRRPALAGAAERSSAF
jgi:hypothetical protein